MNWEIIELDKVKNNNWDLICKNYRTKTNKHNHNLISIKSLCESNLTVLTSGKELSKRDMIKGSYLVIQSGKNNIGFHNEYNFENIVTISNITGYVNYYKNKVYVSRCYVIYSKDENIILNKYIYYALKGQQKYISNLQRGTGTPHVGRKDVSNIEIPLLDISEQRKIVEDLDQQYDLINQHNKLIIDSNQILEEKFNSYGLS